VRVVRGVWQRIRLGLLTAAALVFLTWAVGTREEWGPELATDPAYRSGRLSVCKAPAPGGEIWPSQAQDPGPQPLERGSEHATVHTFDTTQFTGGGIDVCSEYGFVKLAGISGRQGRVEITVSNPFPGGATAVDDTRVTSELRVIDGRLQIRVVQLTQGVTSFRSFFEKGSRPAEVNVVVQVPQNGTYDLRLTANHQRITIVDFDIRGVLEGYASPGADIDAGLDGPLTVKVSGVSYQAKWAGSSNLAGGTTARLRPLRSSEVELKADDGDVRLEVVGNDVGLDVTTNGSSSDIRIGPTEMSRATSSTASARSAGFDRAGVQLQVRASTSTRSVAVTRSQR
jgi:hypothetical protein